MCYYEDNNTSIPYMIFPWFSVDYIYKLKHAESTSEYSALSSPVLQRGSIFKIEIAQS